MSEALKKPKTSPCCFRAIFGSWTFKSQRKEKSPWESSPVITEGSQASKPKSVDLGHLLGISKGKPVFEALFSEGISEGGSYWSLVPDYFVAVEPVHEGIHGPQDIQEICGRITIKTVLQTRLYRPTVEWLSNKKGSNPSKKGPESLVKTPGPRAGWPRGYYKSPCNEGWKEKSAKGPGCWSLAPKMTSSQNYSDLCQKGLLLVLVWNCGKAWEFTSWLP